MSALERNKHDEILALHQEKGDFEHSIKTLTAELNSLKKSTFASNESQKLRFDKLRQDHEDQLKNHESE